MVAIPFLENLAPWGKASLLSQMIMVEACLSHSRSLAKSLAELLLEVAIAFNYARKGDLRGCASLEGASLPNVGNLGLW